MGLDKLLACSFGCFMALWSIHSLANSSEACPSCPSSERGSYPHSGLWYDADRPGSGLNVDIQNGLVVGTIYSYTESGEPAWFLFDGALSGAESGTTWEISADLKSYSGGSCFSCEFIPNGGAQPAGSIEIEFTSRTRLEFSINGGEVRELRPFIFGTKMEGFLPDFPETLFPVFGERIDFGDTGYAENFSTPWIILFGDPEGSIYNYTNETPRFSVNGEVVHATVTGERDFEQYSILFSDWGVPVEISDYMRISCGSVEQLSSVGSIDGIEQFSDGETLCVVRLFQIRGGFPEYYFMSVDNLGENYFKATALSGETVEGIRIRNRE